jgi:hypothetical protein
MKKTRMTILIVLGLFWVYGVAEIKFVSHVLFEEGGGGWAQTNAADFDNDGKMDFTAGRNGGPIYWWRNSGDITQGWERHQIGGGGQCVGGDPYDVDGDGWMDWVSAGHWYRNTGDPINKGFEDKRKFTGGLPGDGGGCHDIDLADIDGDGRKDVMNHSITWWKMPSTSEVMTNTSWEATTIESVKLWGGVSPHAWGDIDRDGDMDVTGVKVWYANEDGKGKTWAKHSYTDWGSKGKYGWEFRTWVEDYDSDGDLDIISSEGDHGSGKAAWFQNVDGKGKEWKTNELPMGGVAGDLHGCGGHDFDGDGDFDIFVGNNYNEQNWLIFENTDGKGTFVKHEIYKGSGAHESIYADMDADGDIDIISKCWCGGPTFVLMENKSDKPGAPSNISAIFKNNQVEVSWLPVPTTAKVKYTVYRNDVALGTVDSAKYIDKAITNGEHTYRVSVAVGEIKGPKGTPSIVTVQGVGVGNYSKNGIFLKAMVSQAGTNPELKVVSNATGRYTLELYNTQGKRLAAFTGKEQGSNTIPLREYKNGIYVLRLNTLQGSLTEKVVLSR